jgi:hypothetical protein
LRLSAILDNTNAGMPLLLQPSRARPKGTLLLDLVARIFLLLQLLGQELQDSLALRFVIQRLEKLAVMLDIFASNKAFHGASPWVAAFSTLSLKFALNQSGHPHHMLLISVWHKLNSLADVPIS